MKKEFKSKRALIVAIYGVNNIGKTTQIGLFEKACKENNLEYMYVKYPVYKQEPTGPRINAFLREKNPEKLSPMDFQKLNVQNREDFEPTLEKLAMEHDVIILEMYTGSGIAFGMGDGIPKQELVELNQKLVEPDISILLEGMRFLEAKEKNHYFEQDDEKVERIRQHHLELAKDFGWTIVNANQSPEAVHDAIFKEVSIKMAVLGL